MWQNRLSKFLDNPLIFLSFVRARFWYRLVADRRSLSYRAVRFLSASETIEEIVNNDRSIIRVGDGTFGYLSGASIYFNDWQFRYDRKFAKNLERVIAKGQTENILFSYPYRFILDTKADFKKRGAENEWPIWVTAKATLRKYVKPGHTYGDALCFHPRYNPEIDFKLLKQYFLTKNIIIITANVARFKDIQLGKSTTLIEAPGSDAWLNYLELENQALDLVNKNNWSSKEVLFMISAAEAAKIMVYDLTKEGYTAWDTGQFFDLAAKEINALNQ